MKKRTHTLCSAVTALLVIAAASAASAATKPTSPALLDPSSADLATFKTEKDPVLSLDKSSDKPVLKIEFPGASGYPGVDLPLPGGSLDLSAYAGVETEFTNVSQERLNIAIRIDNGGDWKKSPWNTNNVWIAPGETKLLQVTFGQSYGNPGYALDPSAVTAIKILADNPKQSSAILVKTVRGFGTGAPAAAAAAATSSATPSPTSNSADIFTPTAENIAAIKTEKDPVLSLDSSALKVEFPGGSGYPGFDFPLAGGSINLAAFAGIEADVTNLGQERLNINLRADNSGDWQKNPWNTGIVWLDPGETKSVKVNFGKSYDQPGYPLDASKITAIKFFCAEPKQTSAVLVKNLRPFGTGGATTPAAASPASAPVSAGTDSTFSPSIGGELLDLSKTDALAGFKTNESKADLENGKIKVTFGTGSNYPNIEFPVPKGGWNLDAFGAIEVTVTNPNDRKINVLMRVDNPGDWKTEPWNTENTPVNAGETKIVKVTFGQQNGAPAFPLNPKRISAIQIFLERPKPDTVLILSDLKASGGGALTSPADRNVPVTPPEWLGTRPPIEGEWVQTLDENFDGETLNDKLWTPRFPWDGPQPGQLQRYAPENVIVGDGVASFKVEKRQGHENNDPKLGTREFTSGLIQSYDKWTQLYGYFEARVKLPTARGLWPAFWMMPDRGAASGADQWRRRDTGSGAMEIDILEHLTEWGPGRNNVALHWDGYGADHQSWGTTQIYFGSTPDGWHQFGLLWEPGKFTWYIDGKKVMEYSNERISKIPSYLKLNVQTGGWATKDIDESKLPDFFKVDYVRAWQLKSRK